MLLPGLLFSLFFQCGLLTTALSASSSVLQLGFAEQKPQLFCMLSLVFSFVLAMIDKNLGLYGFWACLRQA